MKRIAILGSTGSIGQSALAVVDAHADRLQVVGLAAGENHELLGAQIARYRPRVAAMATGSAVDRLKQAGAETGVTIESSGRDGLAAVASHPDVDLVLCASSGTEALEAVLAAIECGKTIALANKEVLVMAGGIVTEAAERRGVAILPVDSEHNAIHQCLDGRPRAHLRRLVLTASGGPFRGRSARDLANVSADEALRHPTWRMGRKITIDSATLMNKGLEVIEAHWLFAMPMDRVDVVIHPQSIIHSMVEFVDGSLLAQLGMPDMGIPILYALSYPRRLPCPAPPLDLLKIGALTFDAPDPTRFPCLRLAREAGLSGGAAPVVLNAANEIAVGAFLDGRCGFTAIPELIQDALAAHGTARADDLETCLAIDAEVRHWAEVALAAKERR